MNMPDVFYSLDIFCLVLVICWGMPSVDYLLNVQPQCDFSQVMHLPYLALILLYVKLL
jgi:hypothetical protein